ncbi:hypothetical protein ACMZ5A_29095 [Bacillus mobilis]
MNSDPQPRLLGRGRTRSRQWLAGVWALPLRRTLWKVSASLRRPAAE